MQQKKKEGTSSLWVPHSSLNAPVLMSTYLFPFDAVCVTSLHQVGSQISTNKDIDHIELWHKLTNAQNDFFNFLLQFLVYLFF